MRFTAKSNRLLSIKKRASSEAFLAFSIRYFIKAALSFSSSVIRYTANPNSKASSMKGCFPLSDFNSFLEINFTSVMISYFRSIS